MSKRQKFHLAALVFTLLGLALITVYLITSITKLLLLPVVVCFLVGAALNFAALRFYYSGDK